MTSLLEKAFSQASKLSNAEQDLLAKRLLAELEAEDAFDRAILRTTDELSALADEALQEHRRGQSQPLDPDRL